jgi:hypothetical protein
MVLEVIEIIALFELRNNTNILIGENISKKLYLINFNLLHKRGI